MRKYDFLFKSNSTIQILKPTREPASWEFQSRLPELHIENQFRSVWTIKFLKIIGRLAPKMNFV